MKTVPIKLKQLKDVENELSIILACERKPKYDLSIFQILEFIAEAIETSIQSAGNKSSAGALKRFVGKYKLAKLLSKGAYTRASQINGFPTKMETGDDKSAETRLKTALTAFKLHSGPFGAHPVYGDLDKKQWEKVHSILASFLFGYIKLEGDEKIRFIKEKEAKREKFANEKRDTKKHQHQHQHHPNPKEKENKEGGGQHHHHNQNKKWKNKKRHYKGNKNNGGGNK
ncbi:DUF1569 domain-containing protein [Leptospira idonii]|uniref:DUF1569 domain-containing protein n=1 Tax=Leptospira idonii TaxID=1193500 RepID=A0A4R9LZ62_9LEPT|nr:DUF1569 domain-containing protein [Leptospira idonii]TGN19704.1 DUF1569 domain-containing protein [Leptospira idonii]